MGDEGTKAGAKYTGPEILDPGATQELPRSYHNNTDPDPWTRQRAGNRRTQGSPTHPFPATPTSLYLLLLFRRTSFGSARVY